jgi:hypothetical protein
MTHRSQRPQDSTDRYARIRSLRSLPLAHLNLSNIHNPRYYDSWVPTPAGHIAAGGVRTSPSASTDCHNVDFPGKCPDQIDFTHNLIGQWANATAGLFEGDFDDSGINAGVLRFDFSHNFYWSDLPMQHLGTAPVFGGSSRVPPYKQLTWAEWRAEHQGSQDAGSATGAKHPFANDNWAVTLNLTLAPNSQARAVGFTPIDTSDVGPRKQQRTERG